MAKVKVKEPTSELLGEYRVQEYDNGSGDEGIDPFDWKEVQWGRENGRRDMGVDLEYL